MWRTTCCALPIPLAGVGMMKWKVYLNGDPKIDPQTTGDGAVMSTGPGPPANSGGSSGGAQASASSSTGARARVRMASDSLSPPDGEVTR